VGLESCLLLAASARLKIKSTFTHYIIYISTTRAITLFNVLCYFVREKLLIFIAIILVLAG